jgi:hypothetical protein
VLDHETITHVLRAVMESEWWFDVFYLDFFQSWRKRNLLFLCHMYCRALVSVSQQRSCTSVQLFVEYVFGVVLCF